MWFNTQLRIAEFLRFPLNDFGTVRSVRQPFGETLVGGDAWKWTVVLDETAAAGSTLKYFFRTKEAEKKLDLAATSADGDTFEFSATSEETNALVGTCSWGLYLFDVDKNRTELARGTVEVLPDLSDTPAGFDGRSWTKRMLDAVCAVLENRASRVEQQYQIGGRQVGLLSPEELLKLKGDLQASYRRELIDSGQRSSRSNQLKASFGPRKTDPGGWV